MSPHRFGKSAEKSQTRNNERFEKNLESDKKVFLTKDNDIEDKIDNTNKNLGKIAKFLKTKLKN